MDSHTYPRAWSKENLIAFWRRDDDQDVVGLAGEYGENTREVARVAAEDYEGYLIIGWTNEGKLLVQKGGTQGILASIDPDGFERTYDTPPVAHFSDIDLSHNGGFVAWNGTCGGPSAGIWTLNVATGDVRQIAEDCSATDLAWSPDDTQLAYTRADRQAEHGQPSGLYVADLESGSVEQLTNPTDAAELRVEWSPTGDGFLVTRDPSFPRCSDCRTAQTLAVSKDGAESEVSPEDDPSDASSGDILVVNEGLWYVPAAGDRRLLFAPDYNHSLSAKFSPDGKWATIVRSPCPSGCDYP